MPLIVLSLLIQAALVVHILKTGRDNKWVYIVLLFPAVGSLAYLLVELLPEFARSRTAQNLNRALVDKIDPHRELRQHSEALEVSPTVQNLLNLASELVRKQQFDEALALYSQAQTGIYADDPKILLAKAECYFLKTDYAQAKTALDELIQNNPDFKSADGHLLYAQILEQLGDLAGAEQEYQALCEYYAGPEPKCRYAQLLQRSGRPAAAQKLYQEVLATAKRQGKPYQRLHQHWVKIAQQGSSR